MVGINEEKGCRESWTEKKKEYEEIINEILGSVRTAPSIFNSNPKHVKGYNADWGLEVYSEVRKEENKDCLEIKVKLECVEPVLSYFFESAQLAVRGKYTKGKPYFIGEVKKGAAIFKSLPIDHYRILLSPIKVPVTENHPLWIWKPPEEPKSYDPNFSQVAKNLSK